MKKNRLSFSTRSIHGNQENDPQTGAVMPPIYLSSTYAQSEPGKHTGFEYSRDQNPTRYAYQNLISNLENASHGFAFSSGMGAISTLIDYLPAKSHVISMDDVYGGTRRLFERVKKQSQSLEFSFIDLSNLELLEKSIKENTKLIWIETPTNPLLKICDLEKIASIAKKHNLLTCVDNTFASPYCQNPIDLGCDIVMHSATKYINGHSDMIGGVLVTNNNQLAKDIKFLQNSIGAVASPFDSYISLRGLKTIAVRMERICENAMAIASHLENHPKVEKVIYPGLKSHPQHDIAKKQMRHFSGMITIFLKADLQNVKKFLSACKIFTLAESLGGIESLIEHPAIMTHASVPKEERDKIGISDQLIRLSVGIEDKQDLIDDLENAFSLID